MHTIRHILLTLPLLLLGAAGASAQDTTADSTALRPVVRYGQPRRLPIGHIAVEGLKDYEDYVLIGISGLSVGEEISLPGDEITTAVKNYWNYGFFSNVRIEADEIRNDSVYLSIHLATRPRVAQVNINGVKKSERDDLEQKIGIVKGSQISPNRVDKAIIVIKKYLSDKGFKNAEAHIVQRDNPGHDGEMIVDVNIDKKEKVKVSHIYITGNDHIRRKRFTGGFFSGGLLKKTNEKGFKSFFKTKKFIQEKYEEDKARVIDKYNELGYRDAAIEADSVVSAGENLVDVYLHIDEGQKYYVRNISWVGNTVYDTDALTKLLQMERGDVYNMKHINDRLATGGDADAVANCYYNNGYVFNSVVPVAANVDGDSIDLEIRIREGKQATIDRVKIHGNTHVYEDVVRRELAVKPGDLFSMDALKYSYQTIGQLGHFDAEAIDLKPVPDESKGTVDINLGLTRKPSDQLELSLGWGYTGVIVKAGIKFTNFSMANLLGRNKNRRGILPQGDGQQVELSASTNGRYYQSYSLSFTDPWFGGKRPNQFSVSGFYSRYTDISSNYYNNSYYNSYYSMLYGYGNYNNSYYNNYSSYYDPDKYLQVYGLSIGWGKRLSWPDNRFRLSASLGFTRYSLKDWEYFLITDGNCNNINLTLALSRLSIDDAIFPRSGSDISLSVSATPPYSLFDGLDYADLQAHTGAGDADRMRNLQKIYRWVEYHKWKFTSKFYTPLSSARKTFVLMTRFDAGFLGHYNRNKKSPFETFFVGGDGMSGYSSSYYSETIALRGYENGALTPAGQDGYAYTRIGLELRYPLMLQNATNIYALAFAEGGNAWTDIARFNPFSLKRSAGFGVRIFLPMVGMMGIDWAYGFDKVFGTKRDAGSHFHFVLGQEF